MSNESDFILPKKAWFSLRELCAVKGISYKTVLNKPELKPVSDGHIGGRKMYSRRVALDWILLSDEEFLLKEIKL